MVISRVNSSLGKNISCRTIRYSSRMATSKSKGVINIEKQGLLGSQMTPNPKFLTRDKSIPKRLTMGIKRMLE